MIEFEIHFSDLNSVAQAELLRLFKTTVEAENWDTIPIVTVYREKTNTTLWCICEENMDQRFAKWNCPVHGERMPDYERLDKIASEIGEELRKKRWDELTENEQRRQLARLIDKMDHRRDEIREGFDVCDKKQK